MQQVDMLKTYKLFLNNLPWPVWIEGIDSKILYLNKHYEDKFR